MRDLKEKKLDELLTRYIDGDLSKEDIDKIETIIANNKSVKRGLDELKKLKELLSQKKKLTPNIGFWTRLSYKLDEEKKGENSFLPFPRKYVPAITVLSSIAIFVIGFFIIQNRMQFMQFFSEKTKVAKDVYEKSIAHGSLLPLFSKIDKDKALQFSLFGSLSLDEKSETSLRIDEQSEKGYRIEVGKDSKKKTKPVTFEHFIAQVKPTEGQRKIIDSLLEITGKRIESSVLIGENNTMAISHDLPPLNRIMVTNIASCLGPQQRVRFERLLEANNAPYKVINKGTLTENKRLTLQHISRSPLNNKFVIITPDTMMYSRININFDSLHRQIEEDINAIEIRREEMLKQMLTRNLHRPHRQIPVPPDISQFDNDGFISVEIIAPTLEIETQYREIIQPRVRKQMILVSPQSPSRRIQILRDTTSEK